MADEVSFTLSPSSASGASAAVADGSSVSRMTPQSVSSESSASNVTPSPVLVVEQGEKRSRSPSSRPKLPPMPENVVVPSQEENVAMQPVGQDETNLQIVSAGARRGSSRDAARAPLRSLLPAHPQREPHAMGAWTGTSTRGSSGTPRDRGEGQPPRVPSSRATSAPMPTLPSLLPFQPPPPMDGVMVAVDGFDLEGELAQEMATDQANVRPVMLSRLFRRSRRRCWKV